MGDAAALVRLSAGLGQRGELRADKLALVNEPVGRARAPRAIWAAAALVLAGAALLWFIKPPAERELAVGVRVVEVVGSPATSRVRLAEILREAIRSHPGLSLRVRCNEYVCSSLLQREGLSTSRSDTRSLLPSDPDMAWRRRIEQGIHELFPDR